MKRVINQELTRDKIIQLRKIHNYTQKEIAKHLQGSRTYYCSFETGSRKLNEKFLQRLADIYDIDFDEICIYAESDYDKLEKTMNILDSYRPTNYYMVRHGNLKEDIADLIKYFEKSEISQYIFVDPIFNNMGYGVKLINIKKHTAVFDYVDKRKKGACILIYSKTDKQNRRLLSIDDYIALEDHTYNSLMGNLNGLKEEFDKFRSSLPKRVPNDIDEIIANNTEIDNGNNNESKAKQNLIESRKLIEKFCNLKIE